MDSKRHDVEIILKLYELRRDELMRRARSWYVTEFNPQSAKEIVRLMLSGLEQSTNYRMITSYWDMAASLVINGFLDEKLFLAANTEHVAIFAKLEPFIAATPTTQPLLLHLEKAGGWSVARRGRYGRAAARRLCAARRPVPSRAAT